MMARYDRLAPLGTPSRDQAFPGWFVFRDLEDQERDSDAGRRARLHFLAVRPLHRLIARGAACPRESLDRQIDRVREELGQLPSRDPERAALSRFLDEMRTANVDALFPAVVAISTFALENGRSAAAEEYGQCALDLAERLQRDRWCAAALRTLSQIALQNGSNAESLRLAERACDRALAADDRAEWLRSTGAWAAAHRGAHDATQARDVLLQGLRRARDWGDDALVGLALSQLCRHAAALQQYDSAVEHGWPALRLLDSPAERACVLILLGDSLLHLGLLRPAERCFTLVAQRAFEPAQRARATAGVAACAAHNADLQRFQDRRAAALRDLVQVPRFPRAEIHCALAHAALLMANIDLAREHAREAIALLGEGGPGDVVVQAERTLHELERHAAHELARSGPPATDQTRRIAAEVEQAPDPLAVR